MGYADERPGFGDAGRGERRSGRGHNAGPRRPRRRTARLDSHTVAHTAPNGSYSLRLELKPAELGRVEMRVEMRDGVLHASIHADHESSAQLVRAALNELRDQLASEGVRTGTLTVSDGALGSSGRDGNTRQANGDPARRGAATEPGNADEPSRPATGEVPPTPDSDTTSLLDVRV